MAPVPERHRSGYGDGRGEFLRKSVVVRRLLSPQRCDLCTRGVAIIHITNGEFFVLETCAECWRSLCTLVDGVIAESEIESAQGGSGGAGF